MRHLACGLAVVLLASCASVQAVRASAVGECEIILQHLEMLDDLLAENSKEIAAKRAEYEEAKAAEKAARDDLIIHLQQQPHDLDWEIELLLLQIDYLYARTLALDIAIEMADLAGERNAILLAIERWQAMLDECQG